MPPISVLDRTADEESWRFPIGTDSPTVESLGFTADVSMVMVGARFRPSDGVSGALLPAILEWVPTIRRSVGGVGGRGKTEA